MADAGISGNGRKNCQRCDTAEQVQVSLDCGHSLCLVCMSYVVIKCRANGSAEAQVICPASGCGQACTLGVGELEAVRTTIEETLLPRLNSIEQITEIGSAGLDHNTSSIESCIEHPLEQCGFVCLTCSNTLLCVRCVLRQSHHGHLVKPFNKGIEYLTEQLSVPRLRLNQTIGMLQLNQRRLHDRKQHLSTRCAKASLQITDHMGRIIACVRRKEVELLHACRTHYDSIQSSIDADLASLNTKLEGLQRLKSDFGKLRYQKPSSELFSLFKRVKNEADQQLGSQSPRCPRPSVDAMFGLKQLDLLQIIEGINKLKLEDTTSFGVEFVSNPVSATNLTSLNSVNSVTRFTSKDNSQRQSKHLKTEESDHIRGKLRCGSPGQLPSYVTRFLEQQKSNSKPKLSVSALDQEQMATKHARRRKVMSPLESLKSQKLLFEKKKNK